jgi:PASTA domain
MNRLTRIVLIAGLASALMLSITAAASANTATIGSALQHPNTPSICSDCVGVQLGQAGGSSPLPLTSPANGTVTSWAVRSGDVGAVYTLRILRPTGGNTFTSAGTSTAPSVPGGTLDSILSHVASLPIKQGDAIGVALGPTATGLPQFTSNNQADVLGYSTSVPPDGTPVTFVPLGGHELLLQATVQFCSVPNLHKLKKVTAKQLLAAADCGVKVKKKVTNKKKFRGKVLKQKKPAGTTAAPGTVVPIVIGQK